MHGAEFYANKKHKGIRNDGGNSEDGGASHHGGFDSSPRSEDMQSGKTTSLSSPSIKSESDAANSPGQQPINSPMSISQLANSMIVGSYADDYDCCLPPSSVLTVAATVAVGGQQIDSISAIEDPSWPYDDEDIEVNKYFICPGKFN